MDTNTAQAAPIANDDLDNLFEEVDLFSTALIQGGCSSGIVL